MVPGVGSENEGAITMMRGNVPITQEWDTEDERIVRFHDQGSGREVEAKEVIS